MSAGTNVFSINYACDEIIFFLKYDVRFSYLPKKTIMIGVEIKTFRQIFEWIAHPVSAAEIFFLRFSFPDGFVVP